MRIPSIGIQHDLCSLLEECLPRTDLLVASDCVLSVVSGDRVVPGAFFLASELFLFEFFFVNFKM